MVDRAFHSTSHIGNDKVVVFGGICDEITSKHHSSMLFQCDTTSFSCHEPKVYGEVTLPLNVLSWDCSSHRCSRVPAPGMPTRVAA